MLGLREVHLFKSSLNVSADISEHLYLTLSEDEREKASRFRFEVHRNAYIVARGLLRSILSQYVEGRPEDLRFAYGPKGKPVLCDDSIRFNLSHSGDLALFAVSQERRMGVDVELIRPLPDWESIAKQFFSQAEYQDLLALAPSQRDEGFFNCWTRKEAYVKALGDGLHAPLDQFQVTLKPGELAAFVASQSDPTLPFTWSLFNLRIHHQYAAAIAIFGKEWRVVERPVLLDLPA